MKLGMTEEGQKNRQQKEPLKNEINKPTLVHIIKHYRNPEGNKTQYIEKEKEKYRFIHLKKVGAMRSSHGILLLPTATCTLYRHRWYVFVRLISLGCLPNIPVSQERGTRPSVVTCL